MEERFWESLWVKQEMLWLWAKSPSMERKAPQFRNTIKSVFTKRENGFIRSCPSVLQRQFPQTDGILLPNDAELEKEQGDEKTKPFLYRSRSSW
jgi:hypothetical protein